MRCTLRVWCGNIHAWWHHFNHKTRDPAAVFQKLFLVTTVFKSAHGRCADMADVSSGWVCPRHPRTGPGNGHVHGTCRVMESKPVCWRTISNWSAIYKLFFGLVHKKLFLIWDECTSAITFFLRETRCPDRINLISAAFSSAIPWKHRKVKDRASMEPFIATLGTGGSKFASRWLPLLLIVFFSHFFCCCFPFGNMYRSDWGRLMIRSIRLSELGWLAWSARPWWWSECWICLVHIRRISTVLVSFLVSLSSCHAFLPPVVRPKRTIREMFLKIFLKSPEFNRSIIFSR